jgi:hypothetical protein
MRGVHFVITPLLPMVISPAAPSNQATDVTGHSCRNMKGSERPAASKTRTIESPPEPCYRRNIHTTRGDELLTTYCEHLPTGTEGDLLQFQRRAILGQHRDRMTGFEHRPWKEVIII